MKIKDVEEECEQCGAPVIDESTAIHDGEHWFCTHICLGNWVRRSVSDEAPVQKAYDSF